VQSLVSTTWLAEHATDHDLAIFDTTKYLPNEGKDGMVEFRLCHIPGARFFDIDDIADADTDLPHMVPTPGLFARKLSALGVGNDTMVVFYDQKGLASAARGWWMMGLFGHDRAAVLKEAEIFGARIVDSSTDGFALEVTGEPGTLEEFIGVMKTYSEIEVTRSGAIAVSLEARKLRLQPPVPTRTFVRTEIPVEEMDGVPNA